MLKKMIWLLIFVISICMVLNSLKEEVTIQVTHYYEKKELEKESITILEIPKWKFQRIIKEGTISNIDKTFATQIIGNKKNIIIAGHDIPLVFHSLQNITIGMKVYLKKGNKMVEYIVSKKLSVKPTEVQYLEETEEEQLTLITCTENDQKRLIIICMKNFNSQSKI